MPLCRTRSSRSTPAATVDEGNNWINLRWGPLSLLNPVTNTVLANYGPASSSSVIGYVPNGTAEYTAAPAADFYGNARKTNGSVDAGAVEFVAPNNTVLNVSGGPLSFGSVVDGTSSAAQTLTLHNTGGAGATTIAVAVTSPFSRPAGAAGGTCAATLAGGATCTINIVFSPATVGALTGTATITGNVAVSGSPVALSGTGIAATLTASVSPSPLTFGNWATGTTSNAQSVTVTNTGNVALAGGTFTLGGGAPQPFAISANTCGGGLAVAASCTISLTFAPTTATAFSRTLTVAYTGATVTPAPVSLTGTGCRDAGDGVDQSQPAHDHAADRIPLGNRHGHADERRDERSAVHGDQRSGSRREYRNILLQRGCRQRQLHRHHAGAGSLVHGHCPVHERAVGERREPGGNDHVHRPRCGQPTGWHFDRSRGLMELG